jgi:hypothetical protein
MQLGASGAIEAVPSTAIFSRAGMGPSLLWMSPDQGAAVHESLGVDLNPAIMDLGFVSGSADFEIAADTVAGSYGVLVDGEERATNVAFATPVSQLDQLRLMTWDVGHTSFGSRQFDYVIVRPRLAVEPTVTLGPVTCE